MSHDEHTGEPKPAKPLAQAAIVHANGKRMSRSEQASQKSWGKSL